MNSSKSIFFVESKLQFFTISSISMSLSIEIDYSSSTEILPSKFLSIFRNRLFSSSSSFLVDSSVDNKQTIDLPKPEALLKLRMFVHDMDLWRICCGCYSHGCWSSFSADHLWYGLTFKHRVINSLPLSLICSQILVFILNLPSLILSKMASLPPPIKGNSPERRW